MDSTDQIVALLTEIRDQQRELLAIQQANTEKYEGQVRLYRRVQRIALTVLAAVVGIWALTMLGLFAR